MPAHQFTWFRRLRPERELAPARWYTEDKATRQASQVVALIVVALATFVGVLWTIDRSARKLEREIAALD